MVTVFNPQALQDPGPTAAASIINGGLGAASSLLGIRAKNKADILQALLGQAGAGIREKLARENENAQGRTGLEVAIASGEYPGLEGLSISDKMAIDPTTVNSLIGQTNEARMLSKLRTLGEIGKLGSEYGDPNAGGLIERGVSGASKIAGLQQPTSRIQNQTTAQGEVTPQEIAGPSQQGQKRFAVNASQQEILPPAPNLFYEKKKAEAQRAQDEAILTGMELQKKGSLNTAKPEFLYGINEDQTPGSSFANRGQFAIDATGAPLETSAGLQKMTNKLHQVHNAFNALSADKQATIREASASAPGGLDQFYQLGLNVVAARNKGTLNRLRRILAATPTEEQLNVLNTFDAQTPDEVAAITYLTQLFPEAIRRQSLYQSGTGISNMDLRGQLRALGDPTSGEAVFLNNFAISQAKSLLDEIRIAASTNASSYKQLVDRYEQMSGTNFDFDRDIDNQNKLAQAFKKNLPNIIEGKNQQEFIRPTTPNITQPTPVQQNRPTATPRKGQTRDNRQQALDLLQSIGGL